MKNISPYCFNREEKGYLFRSKYNDGATKEEIDKELEKDKFYLQQLKKKNKKAKKKPRKNFKEEFKELTRNKK